jgi:hypothetical protein
MREACGFVREQSITKDALAEAVTIGGVFIGCLAFLPNPKSFFKKSSTRRRTLRFSSARGAAAGVVGVGVRVGADAIDGNGVTDCVVVGIGVVLKPAVLAALLVGTSPGLSVDVGAGSNSGT